MTAYETKRLVLGDAACSRRSGILRTEPLRVSALRVPAAIASVPCVLTFPRPLGRISELCAKEVAGTASQAELNELDALCAEQEREGDGNSSRHPNGD